MTKPTIIFRFTDAGKHTNIHMRASRRTMPAEQAARTHYNNAELRPFDGRPGAMDAYALPSVVAGIRIPRTAPMCAPTTNRV